MFVSHRGIGKIQCDHSFEKYLDITQALRYKKCILLPSLPGKMPIENLDLES